MRPLLLDLYCGAGGAAMGYWLAGFDIVGIDLVPQPNYPFRFIQGDALTCLQSLLARGWPVSLIHASPPCQWSCNLTKGTNAGREYINLIPQTREALNLTGLPTVIENVQGSDLRRDLTLCGEMFNLGVIRHRYFEIGNATVEPLKHVPHRGRVAGWRHGTYYDGPYKAVYGDGGGKGSLDEWREAMGISWMHTRHELAESIPPAFTRYIGSQLIEALEVAA